MFKKSSSTSVSNVLSHTEASICVLIFMGKGETTHWLHTYSKCSQSECLLSGFEFISEYLSVLTLNLF